MYCKDCKYFDPNDTYTVSGSDDYGSCKNPAFVYDDRDLNRKPDQLVYSDHEGYSAGFDVGILFGCIHFEPAKTSTPFGLVD